MGSVLRGNLPGARYRQVAAELRARIQSGAWPHGMVVPSLLALAREFKAGRQIVRLAIKALRDENHILLTANRRLVVKANVGGLTLTKGLLLCVWAGESLKAGLLPWSEDLFLGVLEGAGRVTLPLLVAHDGSLRDGIPRDLQDLPLQGIVLGGTVRPEVLRRYERLPVPVALLDQPRPASSLHFAAVDNERAAYESVERLVELGHRQIAFVRAVHAEVGAMDPDSAERERGFRRALKAFKLPRREGQCVTTVSRTTAASLEIRNLLQARPAYTAVLAASDAQALWVLQAARTLGISMPRALSIACFQGLRAAHPGIAGPRIDFKAMGRLAVAMLQSPRHPPRHERVAAVWTPAASVGPAPRNP